MPPLSKREMNRRLISLLPGKLGETAAQWKDGTMRQCGNRELHLNNAEAYKDELINKVLAEMFYFVFIIIEDA